MNDDPNTKQASTYGRITDGSNCDALGRTFYTNTLHGMDDSGAEATSRAMHPQHQGVEEKAEQARDEYEREAEIDALVGA